MWNCTVTNNRHYCGRSQRLSMAGALAIPGRGRMNNSIFADGAGYVRGRVVPIAEAVLPVTDWGFTRSDVVYDVVHVFKGGFFRLAGDIYRFRRSLEKRP